LEGDIVLLLGILQADLTDAKNRAAHGMIDLQYTGLSAKTYRPRTYAANDNQVCPYPARHISDPGDDVA
jgi:hypothetical protein